MPETVESSFELHSIELQRLGLVEYSAAWELQKELQQKLIAGHDCESLILCSHPAVITVGRSTKPEHLILSREDLTARGIQVFDVERGGSVTYHGPEQLIAYPILNLTNRKKDVGWYMRQLEEVVIRTLKIFTVEGLRLEGKTGVWVERSGVPAKIAFIGVRISRWCTLHGLSINVEPCQKQFGLINPCGLGDIQIVSLRELIEDFTPEKVEATFIKAFCDVFQCRTASI